MRKTLTREVTHTTVKLARMNIVDGKPEVEEMEDLVLIGNVNKEKAQRQVTKEFGHGATVLEVKPDTKKYKMAVEKFIELAEEVTEETEEQE